MTTFPCLQPLTTSLSKLNSKLRKAPLLSFTRLRYMSVTGFQKSALHKENDIRGTRRVSLCLAAVLVLITAGVASAQTTIPIAEEQVLYEAIGEFNNSGPASQQYGYLSSVTGL